MPIIVRIAAWGSRGFVHHGIWATLQGGLGLTAEPFDNWDRDAGGGFPFEPFKLDRVIGHQRSGAETACDDLSVEPIERSVDGLQASTPSFIHSILGFQPRSTQILIVRPNLPNRIDRPRVPVETAAGPMDHRPRQPNRRLHQDAKIARPLVGARMDVLHRTLPKRRDEKKSAAPR